MKSLNQKPEERKYVKATVAKACNINGQSRKVGDVVEVWTVEAANLERKGKLTFKA